MKYTIKKIKALCSCPTKYFKRLLVEDNDRSFTNTFINYLVKHPSVGITWVYVLFSALGLLFEFSLFGWFGINVFNYLNVSDLFISAFKYPRPLLVSLFYLLFLFSLKNIANNLHASKKIIPRLLVVIYWPGLLKKDILIFVSVLCLYATYTAGAYMKAHQIVYNSNQIITVFLNDEDKNGFIFINIGIVGNYLFGIEYTNTLAKANCTKKDVGNDVVVKAIPLSAIKTIKYQNILFRSKFGVFLPREHLFYRNLGVRNNCTIRSKNGINSWDD